YRKHTTHMTIDEALAIIKKLKPMQAYLTHLSHEIEYNTTQEILPSGIYLAYDGLKLELEEEK
ncbi:MAG: MBL fold metallo-hydrolase, partial [Halanaerobiales bacterium]